MSKKERIAWMQQAREQLLRKLEPVRPWNIDAEGPYGHLVRDNAELALATGSNGWTGSRSGSARRAANGPCQAAAAGTSYSAAAADSPSTNSRTCSSSMVRGGSTRTTFSPAATVSSPRVRR